MGAGKHAATLWLLVSISCLIFTGTFGRSLRPLERPGALSTLQFTGFSSQLHTDSDNPDGIITEKKKHKGNKSAGAEGDQGAAAQDPGTALQKQAAKDTADATKDATLPPKQEIRNKEVEKIGKSAADTTGVKMNKHGDLATTAITAAVNSLMVLLFVLLFSCLRLRYPIVYCANYIPDIKDDDPTPRLQDADRLTDDTGFYNFWGWIPATMAVSTEKAAERIGLDNAMLLEYLNVTCKILAIVGIPTALLLCPLHFFMGGNGLQTDRLSSVGMANVIMRHPWMYYIHALAVNCITVAIVHVVYGAMRNFLKLRFDWLRKLPSPRCTTVLVEGVPQEWRSDAKVKEYFSAMFPDFTVKAAVMVKHDHKLHELHEKHKNLKDLLQEAEQEYGHAKEKALKAGEDENDPALRPIRYQYVCFGERTDAIKDCEEQLEGLADEVKAARDEAIKEALQVGGVNTGCAFITFAKRREACIAIHTNFSKNREEWIVSAPPPAADVLWRDLKQDISTRPYYTFLGVCCGCACYVFFLPIVVGGTVILVKRVDFGYFQPFWLSFAPGLMLMLFLGFLPTIFLLIFRTFFTLIADCRAQHKLQIWYFFFLMFFVVLVTIIGNSFFEAFTDIVRRPETAMEMMADKMPGATHFYMDLIMLQWGEQAMSLLRHVNLIKFKFFSLYHDQEHAKDLSEPEDQDYYGIGARSARFTINACIGIIFGTLSPLIGILTLILFLMKRLFYGYLIIFAETRKPDLGGVFFVSKLRHMLLGTAVYNVLMIGVLGPSPIGRARTCFPMILTLPSLLYTLYSYNHIRSAFDWADLPHEEFVFHAEEMKQIDNGMRYQQEEFLDDKTRADLRTLSNMYRSSTRML